MKFVFKTFLVFLALVACTAHAASNKFQLYDSKGREAHPHVRPSATGNRTYVHRTFENLTANTTLYSVVPGKTFYLEAFGLNFINTSTSVTGRASIRDVTSNTVTDKVPLLVPQAVALSVTPATVFMTTLDEPVSFGTSVCVSVIAGTLTGSGFLTGYEE